MWGGTGATNYWVPLLLIGILVSAVSAVIAFPTAKTMNADSAARQLVRIFVLAVVASVVVCVVIAAIVTTNGGAATGLLLQHSALRIVRRTNDLCGLPRDSSRWLSSPDKEYWAIAYGYSG